MNNQNKKQIADMLNVPEELIEAAVDLGIPSINNQATGGKGGRAISLTYIDNYSTLMLVYTFLLNLIATQEQKDEKTTLLNQSLLKTLEASIKEQQDYRKEFLNAVELLKE